MSHRFVEKKADLEFDKKCQKSSKKMRQIWTVPLVSKEIFMEYNIGDIVRTKKQHPCGSKIWEITRIGVDFKLKCQGCGHVVILPREKAIKSITKKIQD